MDSKQDLDSLSKSSTEGDRKHLVIVEPTDAAGSDKAGTRRCLSSTESESSETLSWSTSPGVFDARHGGRLRRIDDDEFQKILTSLMNNFTQSRVESVLTSMHKRYLQSRELGGSASPRLGTQGEEADEREAEDIAVVKAKGLVDFHQSERGMWEKNREEMKIALIDINEDIKHFQDEMVQKTIQLNRLLDEFSVVKAMETRVAGLESQAAKHQQKVEELKGVLMEERFKFEQDTLEGVKEMEVDKQEEIERKRLNYHRDIDRFQRMKDAKVQLVAVNDEASLNAFSMRRLKAKKEKDLKTCHKRSESLMRDVKQITTLYGNTTSQTDTLRSKTKDITEKGRRIKEENQRLRDQLLERRMMNLCMRRKIINFSLRNEGLLKEMEEARNKLGSLSSLLRVGKSEMEITQRGIKAMKDDILRTNCNLNFKISEKNVCLKKLKDMTKLLNSERKQTRQMEKKIVVLRRELRRDLEQARNIAVMNASCEESNLQAEKKINDLIALGTEMAITNDLNTQTMLNHKKANEELTRKMANAHLTHYNLHCHRNAIMDEFCFLMDTIADYRYTQKVETQELKGLSKRINEMVDEGKQGLCIRLKEAANQFQRPQLIKEQTKNDQFKSEKWRTIVGEDFAAQEEEIKAKQRNQAALKQQVQVLSNEQQMLLNANKEKGMLIAMLTHQRNWLCNGVMQRKTELSLMATKSNELKHRYGLGLVTHTNLRNDLAAMKKGIRELRWKVKQAQKRCQAVKGLQHSLIQTCKAVVIQKAELKTLEAKYKVREANLNFWKDKLDKEPSQYEIQLKVQTLTSKLITKTEECAFLEETLFKQVIFMQKLQVVIFRAKAEPDVCKKILFKRAEANKKEKELKAVTAELNMTKSNVLASQSAIQSKEERIKQIRGWLHKKVHKKPLSFSLSPLPFHL